MNHKTQNNRPWHSIELAILQHVGRYGITTSTALTQQCVKGVQDRTQAKHRLTALARRGDVKRLSLPTGEACFLLTNRSVEQLNRLGIEQLGTITNQLMLHRCYALLQLCCQETQPQRLLLPTELERTIPSLPVTGRPSMLCLSQTKTAPMLTYVRVDGCGRGRWDRLARKAGADMQRLKSVSALTPFIQRGQLELCIITALPDKAERLAEIMSDKQQTLGIRCRIVALPGLLQFVQPQPDPIHSKILSPALQGN